MKEDGGKMKVILLTTTVPQTLNSILPGLVVIYCE